MLMFQTPEGRTRVLSTVFREFGEKIASFCPLSALLIPCSLVQEQRMLMLRFEVPAVRGLF